MQKSGFLHASISETQRFEREKDRDELKEARTAKEKEEVRTTCSGASEPESNASSRSVEAMVGLYDSALHNEH